MFPSVRARLTWWYTGVLALVLLAFAFATYFFFEHTISTRSDDDLAEMSGAFAETVRAEQSDQEGVQGNIEAGAREAIREFRFRDHEFYVFDDQVRLIGSTIDLDVSMKDRPPLALTPIATPDLQRLVTDAIANDHALATVRQGRATFRAYAEPVVVGDHHEAVVVARSLQNQRAIMEDFQDGLFIAIPLALLCASAGGYFLARKSLAPVVVMSGRVAQMSAANLKERLPIANPSDELGRLALVFNELLARLEGSFEQQRRFMADASHELRTPIAIVRGEAEVALSQPVRREAEYRESLAIVHDEARRLTHIVEDLFTLARADAGQYPLHFTKHSLDELVIECVRSVRTLAQQRGISLRFNPPGEMPFHGDEELLRHLCMNLLDNAIKFTPRGGSVSVDWERHDGEYVLTVSDTGPGIPREAQPHIFERFFRVDKTRSRAEGGFGAGLGLPIARWIAEAHHGRLELRHSTPDGSAFVVCLPVPTSSSPDTN
jgi:two-component system OmpR family sensor kinase